MMTDLQRVVIAEMFQEFNDICKKYVFYDGESYCHFTTFRNEDNPEDKNVVVNVSTISGISDNDQVFVDTNNFLIEADGKKYVLGDLFTSNQVIDYLRKLKKFNWNG
jgi:hypothetical protein